MTFADDARRGHLGTGLQRVDRRKQALARALAREHDGSGEVRERVDRRRIGEVVRRHIHCLNRGDGAGVRVGNALLQARQLGAHRRLITQARRHLAHQAGHLHAGLDEAKDVVDEQQHVAMLVVAEILGHRQRGVADAETTPRRLVHLSEDHHHVRQHAGCLHVAVDFLALATTLADAAEDADAVVMPDHVVDHFGEQHRLAHARPTEEPRLAAALQRHEHIDDLDARLEDLRLGGAPGQGWWRPVYRTPLDIGQRPHAVDGVAEHVEHARQDPLAHRRHQRPAGVVRLHAASQTLCRRQRNRADVARIQLRQNFDDDLPVRARSQQRLDRWQARIEPHVHDAAAYRDDHAGIRRCVVGLRGRGRAHRLFARRRGPAQDDTGLLRHAMRMTRHNMRSSFRSAWIEDA